MTIEFRPALHGDDEFLFSVSASAPTEAMGLKVELALFLLPLGPELGPMRYEANFYKEVT